MLLLPIALIQVRPTIPTWIGFWICYCGRSLASGHSSQRHDVCRTRYHWHRYRTFSSWLPTVPGRDCSCTKQRLHGRTARRYGGRRFCCRAMDRGRLFPRSGPGWLAGPARPAMRLTVMHVVHYRLSSRESSMVWVSWQSFCSHF